MQWLYTLLLFCMLGVPSWAEQESHRAAYYGDQVKFRYVWKDQYGVRQQLNFQLPIDDLERGMREFQLFDNNKANAEAFKAVKNYAQKYTKTGDKLTVKPVRDGYTVEYGGYDSKQGAKHIEIMAQLRDKAFETYMFDHYYTRIDAGTIMPDHKRIAQRYVKAVAPMADAIRAETEGMTPRQRIDYVLNFFQSIPYDQLRSRYTSNGAGFQTPYGLLKYNRGDCDTKSVALAAVMRNLFPHVRIVMVYVPHHAFVGLHFLPDESDYALQLSGAPFVLADPTGPAQVRLGQVADHTRKYLEGGQYSYQEIPF